MLLYLSKNIHTDIVIQVVLFYKVIMNVIHIYTSFMCIWLHEDGQMCTFAVFEYKIHPKLKMK